MKDRKTLAAGVVLLALIVMTIACEDSDVTAPEGSTITLDASPATIYIDQAAGENQGQTTMFAQIIDAGGLPVSDVPLVFSTDGGLLGSINNFCADDGNCIRGTQVNGQPIPCNVNDDCPELDPIVVETNDSGIAQDVLLLRLVEDADQASVTVRGTSLQTTETVRKIINLDTPAGSTISMIASPGTVFIDQDAGETEGQTTMVAQVLDNNNSPLSGIRLLFSTDGGRLGSVDNICVPGPVDPECSKTGISCTTSADCAEMLPNPEAVFTDQDGIATDTLSLRLIEDPDSVVVTAKGTTLLTNHVVTKTVNLGPVDPEAIIEVDPPIGQRVGYPFQLDGSNSTFDPQVDLTCFEWDILYGIPIFDVTEDGCVPCQNPDPFNNPNPLCTTGCVDRGSNRSVVTLSLGDPGNELLDQNLSITLRVSDDPTIVCQNDLPVDDRSKFSPFLDTETYLIRCDLTDPLVEAGGDRFESLSAQGGTVSLTLTATSSDPEDIPPLDHRWDCGNGIVQDPLIDGVGETFTCVYVTTGTFTATVEVENDCGRSVQDSLIVQINP